MMTYTYFVPGLKPDAEQRLQERVKKDVPRIVKRDNDFLRACGIVPLKFQTKMQDNQLFLRIEPEVENV